MSFTCGSCGKETSAIKLAGNLIGQLGLAYLKSHLGIVGAFSSKILANELTTGILCGLNLRCPKCGACNWE